MPRISRHTIESDSISLCVPHLVGSYHEHLSASSPQGYAGVSFVMGYIQSINHASRLVFLRCTPPHTRHPLRTPRPAPSPLEHTPPGLGASHTFRIRRVLAHFLGFCSGRIHCALGEYIWQGKAARPTDQKVCQHAAGVHPGVHRACATDVSQRRFEPMRPHELGCAQGSDMLDVLWSTGACSGQRGQYHTPRWYITRPTPRLMRDAHSNTCPHGPGMEGGSQGHSARCEGS